MIGVLASGNGTNLQALLDGVHGRGGIEIIAVGSDKADAIALTRAQAHQIPTAVFAAADFAGGRAERDRAMADWLKTLGSELVVLAGYLQLVSSAFLDAFPERVINVHPALLPAFPGLDAVGQALEYGVKIFGVTVHFVDAGVDTGPIILQKAAELPRARSREDVQKVLRGIEHQLLPQAVRLIADGAVRRDPEHPRRVLVRG